MICPGTNKPARNKGKGTTHTSLTINNYVVKEERITLRKESPPWPACSRVSQVAETQGLAHLLRNAFKELSDNNLKWRKKKMIIFANKERRGHN